MKIHFSFGRRCLSHVLYMIEERLNLSILKSFEMEIEKKQNSKHKIHIHE